MRTINESIIHRIEIYQEGIKKAELEKDISSQMYLRGALEELKWLKKEYADQPQEPKQREVSEAIEFAEWIISNEYEFFDNTSEGNIYISDEKPNKQFTMGELYDLFKSKTK